MNHKKLSNQLEPRLLSRFFLCKQCINIENIQEVNRCTDYLEAGVAIVVEIADDITDAKEIEDYKIDGIIDSLQDLMSVVGMHDDGIDKILVEL